MESEEPEIKSKQASKRDRTLVINYIFFLNFGILFQEEVCTTEELTKIEHPTECPTPIGTPTDCLTDCWSPGVDDVDCPTGTVVKR